MQNPSLQRSAGYAGILGAICFALSGILPGQLPQTEASASDIAAYIASHRAVLEFGGWLLLPSVALILWFVYGMFDYLRDPEGRDNLLVRWGGAGAIAFATLGLASAALEAAAALRPSAASDVLATIYVFDIVLVAFSSGAFAMWVFSVAKMGGRRGALPGWLNAFSYLVAVLNALYTLSVLVPSGPFSPASVSVIVTGMLSALWLLVASIVLARSVAKAG